MSPRFPFATLGTLELPLGPKMSDVARLSMFVVFVND